MLSEKSEEIVTETVEGTPEKDSLSKEEEPASVDSTHTTSDEVDDTLTQEKRKPEQPIEGKDNKPRAASDGESVRESIRSHNRHKLNRELQEMQRVASTLFAQSHIGNVFIGQGQHLYNPEVKTQRIRFTSLAPDEIEKLTQVYLKPRTYDTAYKCLKENRWVILQGRPQVGKRASALYMAFELQGRTPDLHELSPETDLKKWIDSEDLNENRIYFIDSLTGVRAQELQAYDWRTLRNVLAEKRSYLVISVKEGVRFTTDMPSEVIHTWLPPEDARTLVRKHLLCHKISSDEAKKLLEDSTVADLIKGNLSPGQASLLAERLAAYQKGEISFLDEALKGFVVYDDKSIRDRLSVAKDDSERAFHIALAVFNGARYRSVEEATDRLALLLSPPSKKKKDENEDEEDSEVFNPFFEEDDRIERAQAELAKEYPSEDSILAVEVVRFTDPAYQPALLSFVWRKFRRIRTLILEWLREYGRDLYSDMRMRTAATVAFLAQHEFETVVIEVLRPWAYEGVSLSRQTLGYTFASLIRIEQYSDATLALLRDWSRHGNVSLVWAAARAYGVIGPYYPREAMDRWLEILRRYNFIDRHVLESFRIIVDDKVRPLYQSLFDAINTFFILSLIQPKEDFVRIYKQIISSLRDWVDVDEEYLFAVLIAIPLFVELMALPIATKENEKQNEEDDKDGEIEKKDAKKGDEEMESEFAPALLVLIDACEPNDPCIQDLAWLLSVSIRTQVTRRLTVNVGLFNWVAYVNRDPYLYDALESILSALVQEEKFNHKRWHRELGRPLENWANYSKKPMRVARNLVKSLGIHR